MLYHFAVVLVVAARTTTEWYSAFSHPGQSPPLSRETRGQRIRESGDTGDTAPRPVSPQIRPVFPGQTLFGDTGDAGDTF